MTKKIKFTVSERHYYIYVIYLSTIEELGKSIIKFGRTYNVFDRFRGYPKNSTVLFLCKVKDGYHVEKEIQTLFEDNFKHESDYGREYFSGDIKMMISTIHQLITHMNQELESDYTEIMNSYIGHSTFKISNDNELNDYIDYIEGLKLKDNSIKRKIKIALEKEKEEKEYDLDTNLIGFSNGVYDFNTMNFRQVKPEDMIKKTCKYDYVSEYKNRENVLDSLAKIFPNRNAIDFFMMYVATAMFGKNNSKLLLLLKCASVRHSARLMRILSATFGEYYNCIEDLSEIIASDGRIPKDLSHLKYTRIIATEGVQHITANEICKLIDSKQIKHKNKRKTIEVFNVEFSTLCMCVEEPIIDMDVLKNTATIVTSNSEYEDVEIDRNDFFLLLIEYLKRINSGEITLDRKLIEATNGEDKKNHSSEKICQLFMNDCVEKYKGREKSTDVYNKYLKWSSEKGYETNITKKELFLAIRENRKKILYKRAVNFGGSTYPAFIGITLTR